MSDLLVSGRSRLSVRVRAGWTQMWKRHDEVEECKELGWIHVRKPSKEQIGEGYKPGEEKGEVLSLTEDKDQFLYAMEIDADRYQRHLEAVARLSQSRFDAGMNGVRESVEAANSAIGRKGGAIKADITAETPGESYDPGKGGRGRGRPAANA